MIQIHDVRLAEDQIEILQRLRHPEALHPIALRRIGYGDVVQRRVGKLRLAILDDRVEHLPSYVLQRGVARDSV